ncbi:MAG: hypothetical protein KDK45_19930, partial [Leptospiraceae bacterium]|nr:hypothetical protein [Leptospiraceae bacterium]
GSWVATGGTYEKNGVKSDIKVYGTFVDTYTSSSVSSIANGILEVAGSPIVQAANCTAKSNYTLGTSNLCSTVTSVSCSGLGVNVGDKINYTYSVNGDTMMQSYTKDGVSVSITYSKFTQSSLVGSWKATSGYYISLNGSRSTLSLSGNFITSYSNDGIFEVDNGTIKSGSTTLLTYTNCGYYSSYTSESGYISSTLKYKVCSGDSVNYVGKTSTYSYIAETNQLLTSYSDPGSGTIILISTKQANPFTGKWSLNSLNVSGTGNSASYSGTFTEEFSADNISSAYYNGSYTYVVNGNTINLTFTSCSNKSHVAYDESKLFYVTLSKAGNCNGDSSLGFGTLSAALGQDYTVSGSLFTTSVDLGSGVISTQTLIK